ncbi:hypothetical protein [Corallococcus sp. CA053C]|uniref:hypothetical protein n=1 Tax=Corallococcus sp. CA053C TaxID=2316732 RepID=UPI0011C43B05|nr:hypothetical protein [Corallococcus sp. CA053C]
MPSRQPNLLPYNVTYNSRFEAALHDALQAPMRARIDLKLAALAIEAGHNSGSPDAIPSQEFIGSSMIGTADVESYHIVYSKDSIGRRLVVMDLATDGCHCRTGGLPAQGRCQLDSCPGSDVKDFVHALTVFARRTGRPTVELPRNVWRRFMRETAAGPEEDGRFTVEVEDGVVEIASTSSSRHVDACSLFSMHQSGDLEQRLQEL